MKTIAMVAILAVSAATQAQLVYDNGAPDLQNGNEMTQYLQAEDVTLGTTQQVASVRFWTIESAGAPFDGNVDWFLFADNNGVPGSTVSSGTAALNHVATGNVALGVYNEYQDEFQASFTLNAGTTYWLGLHMNPSENYSSFDDIFWETTAANSTSGGQESFMDDGSWSVNGNEHAFQLYGPVPEPASLMALVIGAAGVVRRKRSRSAKS